MANETATTMQTTYTRESDDADDDWENIPPEVGAQVENMVGRSSTQPSGEIQPPPRSYDFSTPGPACSRGGVKAKSRLSGLQSALTPILKYLNITNKHQSPESLKQDQASNQNKSEASVCHSNSDISISHPGGSLVCTNAHASLLEDECLPEITLFDLTCDTTMQVTKNGSAHCNIIPAAPVTNHSVCSSVSTYPPSKLNASTTFNSTSQMSLLKMDDLPENALAPLRWLDDRYFPEITLLDVTCDSELSPPVEKSTMRATQNISPTDASKTNMASSEPRRDSELSPAVERSTMNVTQDISPTDASKTNMASLETRHDSELLPAVERSTMNVTQDISPTDASKTNAGSSELSEQTAAENTSMEVVRNEDLSSTLEGNAINHTITSVNDLSNITKASLESTRDISMGSISASSRPSLAPSEQSMASIHTTEEDAHESHPVNVTRDMSSSSDTSMQSATTQSSTSGIQCDTSSKTVTSEAHTEVISNNEEPHTSRDACSSTVTGGSANGTFTVSQSANLSSSSSLNSSAKTPQNKTLELPPSNAAENDARDSATPLTKNTTEDSLVVNQSAVKTTGSCEVQNATFDWNSLQKSSGNSMVGEVAVAGTFCLQNNTFDAKPVLPLNGTITLSETSSNDTHQNTLDKPPPPPSFSSKACNATCSPKNTTSEAPPSETSKPDSLPASTDPNPTTAAALESTFEENPPAEKASEASKCENKDSSKTGLPMTDSLCDSSANQSRDLESNRASTFSLDDTLDLAAAALITSTPMPSCKVFNFDNEKEEGKIFGATKRLYGGDPSIGSNIVSDKKTFLTKPAAESLLPPSKSASHLLKYKPALALPGKSGDVPSKSDCKGMSDVPISNIVSDRKTFLSRPTATSLLPQSKAASHLLKYKPTSLLPGKVEPMTTGLPMTRQRAQADTLKTTAASGEPQVPAGLSNSYNLRPTTTGSKQLNSGLRKPQSSGIPSGIQRAAAGLRPPLTRSNGPAPVPPSSGSSATDRLRPPTATNHASKTLQGKKHPLSRAEALQVAAKRRKMDPPLSSSNAEVSTSSCDATNKVKNVKQPTNSQRVLPAKTQREGAATSTAENSISGDAVSKARALRQPGAGPRPMLAKAQAHGCTNCVALEQQLKVKIEEIKRLKEELQKYRKEEEEC